MTRADHPTGGVLFEEKQHFPRWLSLLMFSPILITVGVTLLVETVDEERKYLFAFIILVVVMQVIVFYGFLYITLQKLVTTDGLFFRWAPVQGYRFIPRREIESMEIRKGPAMKYGAATAAGFGKIHSVSDGEGVQLFLADGKMMFFGTADAFSFSQAMKELMAMNERDSLLLRR